MSQNEPRDESRPGGWVDGIGWVAPAEREELLIRGIVGDHAARYQRSPQFHAMVKTLAQMIPLWADGMADASVEADAAMARAIQMAKDAPPLLLWSDIASRYDRSPRPPSGDQVGEQ